MTDYNPDFYAPVREPHRFTIRAVPHPDELDVRGIPISCPNCHACHDWLLLSVRHQVFALPLRHRMARARPRPRLLRPALHRARA